MNQEEKIAFEKAQEQLSNQLQYCLDQEEKWHSSDAFQLAIRPFTDGSGKIHRPEDTNLEEFLVAKINHLQHIYKFN